MNWKHRDRFNNDITCVNNFVTVKLAQEHKTREIGFYNPMGNFIKGYPNPLSSTKHKFQKGNGYGVNYHVVERLQNPDNKVVFITEEGCFAITKEKILKGDIKQFSRQGFELQYIIPITEMTKVERAKINTRRDL